MQRRLASALAMGGALALGLASAGAPPLTARAASFDCAKAATPTEHAICADAGLSGLDSQIGAAYAQRLAADPSVRQIERAWLQARNVGCGKDAGCLTAFEAAQLAWLRAAGALPSRLPTTPGLCALTAVGKIESRLEGMPGSGSAVDEADGGYQVSYDTVPAIERSRPGDALLLCLISLPTDCPAGDDRGKMYAGANLRTLGAWSEADAEHTCGGA